MVWDPILGSFWELWADVWPPFVDDLPILSTSKKNNENHWKFGPPKAPVNLDSMGTGKHRRGQTQTKAETDADIHTQSQRPMQTVSLSLSASVILDLGRSKKLQDARGRSMTLQDASGHSNALRHAQIHSNTFKYAEYAQMY